MWAYPRPFALSLSKGPCIAHAPFALSLSKCPLSSVRGFDKLSPTLRQAQGERVLGFDQFSPNGARA
jgi:hypothetical protein